MTKFIRHWHSIEGMIQSGTNQKTTQDIHFSVMAGGHVEWPESFLPESLECLKIEVYLNHFIFSFIVHLLSVLQVICVLLLWCVFFLER